MRALAERLRTVAALRGKPEKAVQPCEESIASAIRRSIVAGTDLPAGHCLEMADLTWLRPAGGLPPGEEPQLIGKRLKHAVRFGERLLRADVDV